MRYKVREGYVFTVRKPIFDNEGKVKAFEESAQTTGYVIDDQSDEWKYSTGNSDGVTGRQIHKLEAVNPPKEEKREAPGHSTRPKAATETR